MASFKSWWKRKYFPYDENSFLEWWDTWYLRYHDNWHKQPHVSKICCWIGRHDYIADSIFMRMDDYERGAGVRLICLYCGHGNECAFSDRGSLKHSRRRLLVPIRTKD